MAAAAGVGDAEFLCQQRIGREPAVVVPRRTLHVIRRRHVAGDAGVASAVGLMLRVRERIDGGGDDAARQLPPGRRVTLQAELVVRHGQDRLRRVRIVAIEAGDARVAHAAEQHGGPVEVLVALLTVGIKRRRVDREHDAVVIVVGIAGLEAVGEQFIARVARRAGLHHLRAIAGEGRLRAAGRRVGLVGMRGRRRAVTLDATHAVLDPRGAVAVGRRIVTALVTGHVAVRAHRVPVHAAPGPVAPLAGATVLRAEDVEPFLFRR